MRMRKNLAGVARWVSLRRPSRDLPTRFRNATSEELPRPVLMSGARLPGSGPQARGNATNPPKKWKKAPPLLAVPPFARR